MKQREKCFWGERPREARGSLLVSASLGDGKITAEASCPYDTLLSTQHPPKKQVFAQNYEMASSD